MSSVWIRQFVDMNPLSRDSEFDVTAHRIKQGVNGLFGWLAEV